MDQSKAPEDSFLDLYLRYTQKQESPEMFHLWTGISVLAAALGRKCFINRGYYKLYPNIFCILVAGSARCRKSTAINIGIRLLDGIPSTKVIQGKITPEKFLNELADNVTQTKEEGKEVVYASPSTLVHSSELSVLLTKQSYGEPLIHILTDLFDCPDAWNYKTKNKGEASLRNVFISILAATTPAGIAKGIPESALQEGFASRILFVYQPDTDRRNAFPVLTAEELALYVKLREMLAKRAEISGEFTLTKDARDWYESWYITYMRQLPPDKLLEGMYGRKHDHLLRLGMVFTGSYGESVIDAHHLQASLAAIEALEDNIGGAFAELGGDEYTLAINRAKTILAAKKRMKITDLLQALTPLNALAFRVVRATIFETGLARLDPQDSTYVLWNAAE